MFGISIQGASRSAIVQALLQATSEEARNAVSRDIPEGFHYLKRVSYAVGGSW